MQNKTALSLIFLFQFLFGYGQLSVTQSSVENTNCNGEDCVYNGPSILINEIILSPVANLDGSMYGQGFNTTNPQEGEWVELFNPDECRSVDISCFYLGNNASDLDGSGFTGDFGGGFRLPDNVIVPPLGFVIIRGPNADPVPANLLVANGGNTIELVAAANNVCRGGGTRLWFPNAGGWFAFYDRNGVPQDAISWAANTPNYGLRPCIASESGCSNVTNLPGYNAIPAARKQYIANAVTLNSNRTFRRIPDGGAWVANTEATSTYGTCNTTCIPNQNITCTGQASVMVSGGTPPYNIVWDDSRAQTGDVATQLCAGIYCATITDAQGNTATECVEVFDFKPTVVLTEINDLCIDDPVVTLSGTPVGGTDGSIGIYSGNGVSGNSFNPQTASDGEHDLVYAYEDKFGCKDTDSITVIVHPLPDITANASSELLCLGDSLLLFGTENATYTWDQGVVDSVRFVPDTTRWYKVIGESEFGCINTDSVEVVVVPPPFAGLDSVQIICPGEPIELADMRRENQPDGMYFKNGSFVGSLVATTGTFENPQNPPGQYPFFFVATPDDPCPADTAILVLDVQGYPTIADVTTVCAEDRLTYTVTFTITDGDPTSYAVLGYPGTISSTAPYVFTSDPIVSQTPITFQIQDGFMCKDTIIDVVADCSCDTYSGTMNTGVVQAICGDGAVNGMNFFNTDSVDDGDDRFKFYLHRSPGLSIAGAVDSNTTGTFAFNLATMQYDVTYYISPVIANDIAGNIDFSDICLSVGRGLPVVWHETPELEVSNDTVLCLSNNRYYFKTLFSAGKAPFQVTIEEATSGGVTSNVYTITSADDSILFTPTVNTTYTVLSYTDRFGCAGTFVNNTTTVQVQSSTIATLANAGDYCSNGGSVLPFVQINITGDSASYRVVLSNHFNTNLDTFLIHVPGETVQPNHYAPNDSITYSIFTVIESSLAICPAGFSGTATTYPYPTAHISKDSIYCGGEPIIVELSHTGIGPWEVYVSSDAGNTFSFTTFENRDTIHTIPFLPPGTYQLQIDSLVDLTTGCATVGGTGLMNVTVNPSPRVNLFIQDGASLSKQITYCYQSGPATLEITNFPDPTQSYDMTYQVLGNPNLVVANQTVSATNNTFLFDSIPGTYQVWLSNIKDNTAAGCGGIGDTVTITINPLPTLQLRAIDTLICLGETARIEATVTGNPQISFSVLDSIGNDVNQYDTQGTGVFQFSVQPQDSGWLKYKAFNLADGSIPQCVNSTNAFAQLRVNALPTATVSGGREWCEGTPFTVPISATGEADVWVNYTYNGILDSISITPTIDSVFHQLPAGSYQFQLTSVVDQSPAQCVGTVAGPFQIEIIANPTADLYFNPNPVCLNEAVQVIFSANGNGPFEIDVRDDLGQVTNGISLTPDTGFISDVARYGLSYTIIEIRDNSNPFSGGNAGRCFSRPDSTYPLSINDLPSGYVTADTLLCAGDTSNLVFHLASTPTYNVYYSDGVQTFESLGVLNSTHSEIYIPTDSLTFIQIDSLRDGNGCKAVDVGNPVRIRILPNPIPNIEATHYESCAPLLTTFMSSSTNVPLRECYYFSAENEAVNCNGNASWRFDAPGNYDVSGRLVSIDGCVTEFTLTDYFKAYPNPSAVFDYGPKPVSLTENIIYFKNLSDNADFAKWYFTDTSGVVNDSSDVYSPRYKHPFTEDGVMNVWLHVATENGCIDSTFKQIFIYPEIIIYVPTAFTPNGDGVNDFFRGVVSSPELLYSYSLRVFNRWGQLIFETDDHSKTWDGYYQGLMSKQDTYDWQIVYKLRGRIQADKIYGQINLLK